MVDVNVVVSEGVVVCVNVVVSEGVGVVVDVNVVMCGGVVIYGDVVEGVNFLLGCHSLFCPVISFAT